MESAFTTISTAMGESDEHEGDDEADLGRALNNEYSAESIWPSN